MYFDLVIKIIFGLIWIGLVWFWLMKKKANWVHLIFFTIFYVYLFYVLDYTLFQFQSLIILKYFMPNLMLNGQDAGHDLNLIPLIVLTSQDLETSLLNILLFVPFGFGLPFITNLRLKQVVICGLLFSFALELLQLVSGQIAKVTFRVADINDLIFNALGVLIGYCLFRGFMIIFRRLFYRAKVSKNSIVQFIIDRPQP